MYLVILALEITAGIQNSYRVAKISEKSKTPNVDVSELEGNEGIWKQFSSL